MVPIMDIRYALSSCVTCVTEFGIPIIEKSSLLVLLLARKVREQGYVFPKLAVGLCFCLSPSVRLMEHVFILSTRLMEVY